MKIRSVLLWLVVMFATLIAGCGDKGPWDGPYGVKQGISPDDLSKFAELKKLNDGNYTATSAPTPAAYVKGYQYLFSKKTGLCIIRVHSELSEPEVRSLASGLVKKYGQQTVISPTSKEDMAEWFWSKSTNKLPDNLARVTLYVITPKAVEELYEFENSDSCRKELGWAPLG